MAAISRAKQQTDVKRSKHVKPEFQEKPAAASQQAAAEERHALIEEHLPPFGLAVVLVVCSGFGFIFCLRDFLSTGKTIGGTWDEAMLVCP